MSDFPHCLDFLISTKMRWLRHCTFIICSVSIRMRSIPCPVRVCARSSTTTRSIRLTCTKQLCQILCAYRIFLPYVGITVSSREQKHFRDGIVKIAATKVSAGVSTGIGDHESKYTGKDTGESGDEQFEISDGRSFDQMYNDMESEGLQPVLNDYVYV